MEETFETGSSETSRDQHNNALMMGKGTSDERF